MCLQFRQAGETNFPRRVVEDAENSALLGFADASQTALAAVVYARCERSGACRLVTAKTKVAPAQAASIPRLELASAVMLARLVTVVTRAMPK